MEWLPGDEIDDGRYRIDKILGRGGFGVVYKATHIGLDNSVAIKFPSEKYKEYFNNEIQILAAISGKSDHIVRVRDLFHERDIPCLVMDLIEGDNLFNLIQNRQSPLFQTEALTIVSQIAEALTIIHESGIVHRDVNPKNIILQPNGKAVLIDFGNAENINYNSSIDGALVLKKPRRSQFTKSFAPYEQILGNNDCLPSVDIYSLSATLYYLLTKQYPESADNRKVYNCYLEPPKKHAQISDELNQVIINGMNVDAKDRPDSIDSWLKLSKKLEDTQYSSQFNSEFEEEYKLLEQFLLDKKWIDADMQTAKLMLKIADREVQGWMGMEEWNMFPCGDLKIIDKLWYVHSQGHFGFSTQQNIWKLVDGDWNRFKYEVWWMDEDEKMEKYLYRYFTELIGINKNKLITGGFPTVTKPGTGILIGKIDPERNRQQSIMELQENFISLSQATSHSIAKEKRSMQQYNLSQSKIMSWQQRNDLALRKGDEILSQEILHALQSETSASKYIEFELENISQEVKVKKIKLRALEFKISVLKHSTLLPIEMLSLKLEDCNP